MADNNLTDFEYPHINRTDYIDDSLPKILSRDDASKRGFRRLETFPNVTPEDVGMKVWLKGVGNFQLISVDPEPEWKQLTDDKREPAYTDWVLENYQTRSDLLTSFSRLGTVSNAIPYFNGPNDIQSTAITPLTRNLLAAGDAATIRSGLGLGNVATLNTPLSGNLIQAGSIPSSAISLSDINNIGWSTGDVKMTYKTAPDNGWVMMNDGSIGNAASGATARANADTYDLYMLLWNNPWCPIQTPTGVETSKTTAASDWSSNKRLVLPRVAGRALAGAGSGYGLSSRPNGGWEGMEYHNLTWDGLPFSGRDGFFPRDYGTIEGIQACACRSIYNQHDWGVGGSIKFTNGSLPYFIPKDGSKVVWGTFESGSTVWNGASPDGYGTLMNVLAKDSSTAIKWRRNDLTINMISYTDATLMGFNGGNNTYVTGYFTPSVSMSSNGRAQVVTFAGVSGSWSTAESSVVGQYGWDQGKMQPTAFINIMIKL